MKKVLKLTHHSPEKEIEFELEFLASLSVRERFELMLKKTGEMLELLKKSGHRRPSQIIKRT
jgi:hypothetical protein